MTNGLVQHLTVEESTSIQWAKQVSSFDSFVVSVRFFNNITDCAYDLFVFFAMLTILLSERPKLYTASVFLSAKGLSKTILEYAFIPQCHLCTIN